MELDPSEFEAFVVARYAAMVRAAVLLGVRAGDAEDAVQEALARCYVVWSSGRVADDPDAYAYRVLVNGVRRAGRRRWTGEVPHAELPLGDHPSGERADARPADPAYRDPGLTIPLAQSVRAALGRLNRSQRHVLVLRYFADLTEQQTAAVLGIAPGTVKSRAARAMALLARDPDLAELSPAPPAPTRPTPTRLDQEQP